MKRLPKLISVLVPLLAVPCFVSAPSASAATGSDLVPTVVASGSTLVNSVTHINVRVTNNGNRNSALPTTVYVQLPQTNTSPTVNVMGTLSNVDTRCPRTGTRLICTVSSVARFGGFTDIGFDIVLPVSTNPIGFRVDTVSSNDINPSNNTVNVTAAQTYYAPVVPLNGAAVTNSHCTGTNLSSYFECLLYPSSIASHAATLVGGTANSGSLDFSANGPDAAAYGGTWSVNGSRLTMQYTDNGQVIGNFTGQGSLANCWDGKMSFVPSGEAIYRVCL